ncbi:MAG: carboxypeptidase-like regulatory domain-containing protein [Candidatus Kapabacteria bacterium]|nr:carboxypeptidase-like regulatory domain-containing protein [Candidatus Kapabacteria bacterium]
MNSKPSGDFGVQTSMHSLVEFLPVCRPTAHMRILVTMHLIVICMMFLTVRTVASEDQIVLSGTIVDSASGEPLAGASIRAEGLQTGTYTGKRGTFRLPVAASTKYLIVRSIGYKERRIEMPSVASSVRIAMLQTGVSLRGVNVVADITPEEVIRRAIERRDANARRIRTVVSSLYSKVRFALDLAGMGRSNQQQQDVILETFSTITERRIPDQRKHVRIEQRRQTANIPAQENTAVFDEFFDFTLDELNILKTKLVTPLGKNALKEYNYAITGKSTLDSQVVYEMSFAPRSSLFPGFAGTLSIVDGTYQIIAATFAPSKETSFPFLKGLTFEQRYDRVKDSIWMPTFQLTTASLRLNVVTGLITVKADVRAQTNVRSVDVNVGVPDSLFMPKKLSREDSLALAEAADMAGGVEIDTPKVRIDVDSTADSLRPDFWASHAFAEQSEEEVKVYAKQDSIQKAGGNDSDSESSGPLSGSMFTLARSGDFTLGIDPLFNYSSISQTVYGASVTAKLAPVRMTLSGGFGSGGTRFGRVAMDATLYRARRLSLAVSGSVYSSLASVQAAKTTQLSFSSIDLANLLFPEYQDFFRRDGFALGLQARSRWVTTTLEASWSRHINMPLLDSLPRPRVLAREGDFQVLSLTARSPRSFGSIFGGSSDPFSGLIHGVVGRETVSGSSFWSVDASTTLRLPTYETGYSPMLLELTLAGGVQATETPNQYRFVAMRAFPTFGILSDFPTIGINAFAGTEFVRFGLEHNFTDLWWRAIGLPGLVFGRGVDLIGVLNGISTTNRAGAVVPGVSFDSTNGVYMEAGVGVARIPSFISDLLTLRVDARWPVGPLAHNGSFGWILTLSSPLQ